VCCPVKVGGRGGNLVFFEDSQGVSRGVVDIQVTQGEGGKGIGGEDYVRWNRTSVVGATFGAVSVRYGAGWGGFSLCDPAVTRARGQLFAVPPRPV